MLEILGAGLQVVGAGTSIYGNIKKSKADQRAGRIQAKLLEIQADQTVVRGREEASRSTAAFFSQSETQLATAASANVDVNSGVSKVIQSQFTEVAKIESTQIKKNAQMEADNLQAQATNIRDSAEAAYHGALIGAAGQAFSAAGGMM